SCALLAAMGRSDGFANGGRLISAPRQPQRGPSTYKQEFMPICARLYVFLVSTEKNLTLRRPHSGRLEGGVSKDLTFGASPDLGFQRNHRESGLPS
ncbi:MAG TPA: hypothetical protein VL966_18950, partial [Alphaproteobacteria bacterium]|nr:hypothetical protein [Alphaproteobacteria bacterium]